MSEEPIKNNRILGRKPGIAGIPADVFIIAITMDLVIYLFTIQILQMGWQVFALTCIIVDGTWVILTLRGVWRFVGLFFKPPRYFRANIPYRPQLKHGVFQNSPRQNFPADEDHQG
jgi:hypothetical protein